MNFLFHPFSTQRGVAEFWTVTVSCHHVLLFFSKSSALKFGGYRKTSYLCSTRTRQASH